MLKYKIPGWFHRDQEKRPTLGHLLAALIGSFTGIAVAAYLSLMYHQPLLVPSLGASAVLLYAAPHAPMAHPRNVLGGHLVSAVIGVSVYRLWGLSWWALALGVSLAIIGMMVTDTIHPPGGATAFAAVFTQQDYGFVIRPVAVSVVILVVVAIVLHNLGSRKYPVREKKEEKLNQKENP